MARPDPADRGGPAAKDHAPAPIGASAWADRIPGPDDEGARRLAERIARLLSVDPSGLGGVVVRGPPGPERRAWLDLLRRLRPASSERRLTAGTRPERLLGGLDLTATLAAGRPILGTGLLSEADGGRLVIPGAERLDPRLLGPLVEALDRGAVGVERDGFSARCPARVSLVLLDEAGPEDPGVPGALLDRLAFRVSLPPRWRPREDPEAAAEVGRARARLGRVTADEAALRVLVETAWRLGIRSLRPPLLAVRAARAMAALEGRDEIDEPELAAAARLVLGPRAAPRPEADTGGEPGDAATCEGESPADPVETAGRERASGPEEGGDPPDAGGRSGTERPSATGNDPTDPPTDAPEPGEGEGGSGRRRRRGRKDAPPTGSARVADRVVQAVEIPLPRELMDPRAPGGARGGSAAGPGRLAAGSGGAQRGRSVRHGRPVGVRAGDPADGGRLDLLATLKAAAPWQRIRSAGSGRTDGSGPRSGSESLRIRREDLRVRVLERPTGRTTIFAVDASGSQALNRLSETKGAVQRVLAESYARRDRVAVVAFRDEGARVLLTPTRALARARRELAALPGGGATPLAAGLRAALELARSARREGTRPRILLLTDGRANVAIDGTRGRRAAERDALGAARRVRSEGVPLVVVDTSRRGEPLARGIAREAGAEYTRLPRPTAAALGSLARPSEPGRSARPGPMR